MFENRVLGKYLDQKGTGDWRKVHNEELHSLHCSPDIIMMMKLNNIRWDAHVAYHVEVTENLDLNINKKRT